MSHTLARGAVLSATAALVGSSLLGGATTGSATTVTGHVTHRAGATHTASFYEKTATFKKGKDSIEFTDLLYAGNHTKHAAKYTGTDHVEVDLSTATPTADAQFAIDGVSMLLARGKAAGQGTFTIPIIGGTGTLAGAKGTVKVTDQSDGNSDLVFTYTLS